MDVKSERERFEAWLRVMEPHAIRIEWQGDNHPVAVEATPYTAHDYSSEWAAWRAARAAEGERVAIAEGIYNHERGVVKERGDGASNSSPLGGIMDAREAACMSGEGAMTALADVLETPTGYKAHVLRGWLSIAIKDTIASVAPPSNPRSPATSNRPLTRRWRGVRGLRRRPSLRSNTRNAPGSGD